MKFKVKDSENEYFLGWTTTPWTLPANVALAVHPNMEYVKAKQESHVYIVAKERVQEVLKENYEVLSVHKGEELLNTSYTAPFPMKEVTNGYRVIAADFVTEIVVQDLFILLQHMERTIIELFKVKDCHSCTL